MNAHSIPNHSNRDISGYKELINNRVNPKFRVALPGEWQIGFQPAPNSKGFWISARGPLNTEAQQYTSLHITIEEDEQPYRSLDKITDDSINEKRYGESTVLFKKDTIISSQSAREVQIRCQKILSLSAKTVPVFYMVQWTVFQFESRIITITFSSPEQAFEIFLPAYLKAINTFSLIP